MNQPKIRIKDIHDNDFGIKKVKGISWDSEGKINKIQVDFSGIMNMYPSELNGVFKNAQCNLIGIIIWDL